MQKHFYIRLLNLKKNLDIVIPCEENQTILEGAEASRVDLPYSCRVGLCSTCVGKVHEGLINQEEQMFLTNDQLEKGFILTCVAFPKSNATIYVDEEENLY